MLRGILRESEARPALRPKRVVCFRAMMGRFKLCSFKMPDHVRFVSNCYGILCRALADIPLRLAEISQRRQWSRREAGNAMTQSKLAPQIVTPT